MYYFSKMCRICGHDDKNLIEINGQLSKHKITIMEMINECFNLVISENDCMPPKICSQCVNELEISYNFYTKANKTHKMCVVLLESCEDDKMITQTNHDSNVKRTIKTNAINTGELKAENLSLKHHVDVKEDKRNNSRQHEPEEITSDNFDNHVQNYTQIQEMFLERRKNCVVCHKSFLTTKALNIHQKILHRNITFH